MPVEPPLPFRPDHQPTPAELESLLLRAGTFEGLQSCWSIVLSSLETPAFQQTGEVTHWLKLVGNSFSKPPHECDTGVKQIWAQPELRVQLKDLGVPEEFLLHTVRVGALKGALTSIEKSPHEPVRLYSDGTVGRDTDQIIDHEQFSDPAAERGRLIKMIHRQQSEPTLDGYSWANAQLGVLAEAKVTAKATEVAANRVAAEARKTQTIALIYGNMRDPDFHLQPADAALLRGEFASRLTRWRGFIQGDGSKVVREFITEHSDAAITPELFSTFRTRCADQAGENFPWDIMNPASGWFAVLIINRATTLSTFISNLHNNMNSWFKL